MIHLYDGNNVMRRRMERDVLNKGRVLSLRQMYAAANEGSQIWAWDGYRHNERRQAIYPPYKVGRPKTPEDIFAQVKLFREVLRHSRATQIEVEGWEADDIIGTLTRRFVKKGLPVTIHSNDMDYAQLEHLPGVVLNGVNTKGVPGRWVPLYKAMQGDSSDKIAGIPNFGGKRWEQIEAHWPQIERAIITGDPTGFVGIPFKPAVVAWLQSKENIDLLRAMLTVTHFENVPEDELEGGIIVGQHNPAAAHQRLSEFFL